jgi:hypothetical protein
MRTKGKPEANADTWPKLPEWDVTLPEWEPITEWETNFPEWETNSEQLPIYEKHTTMKNIELLQREELEANVATLKNRLLDVSSRMSNTSNKEFALLSKEAKAITSAMRETEGELKRRETQLP